MRRRDDDLSPFRDDPVLQALTGPATPDELAGQAEALAAFRAAIASRPRRRFAARVGASGTAAVVVLALSGGVAAAYSGSLPAPLQHIAHDAGIGVPDTPTPKPSTHSNAGAHHNHSSSAGPRATPAVAVSPSAAPHASPSAHPTGTPSASGTPTAATTPTGAIVVTTPITAPTPTHTAPLKGATLAITVSETKVSVGTAITVTGQLDAENATPIAGRRVALREHVPGTPGWTRVGPVTTSAEGQVTFSVPGIEHNVKLMLHSGRHLHSAVVRVVVLPTITETVTPSTTEPGTATVAVTVRGAEAGDTVVLSRAGGKRHQQAVLDVNGLATFTIRVPADRTANFRIFLPHTPLHGVAFWRFSVSPAS